MQPPLHGVAGCVSRGRRARAEGDVEEADGEEHAAPERHRPVVHVEGEEARCEVDAAAAWLEMRARVRVRVRLTNPKPKPSPNPKPKPNP